MGLKRIDERLSRVTTIIKGWKGNKNVPRIERDMALEELRHIYDEILDYTPEESEEESSSEEHIFVGSAESISDIVDDFDDALDIDALLGIGESEEESVAAAETYNEVVDEVPEVDAESAEEHRVEIHDEAPEVEDSVVEESVMEEHSGQHEEKREEHVEQTVREEQTQSMAVDTPIEETSVAEVPVATPPAVETHAVDAPCEESDVQSVTGALFNLEDIPVRVKSGRKMVHLYDRGYTPRVTPKAVEREESVPSAVATPAPQPERQSAVVTPQPEQEQPKRLGDVLGGDVTTLADTMVSTDDTTTPFNRIEELRKAIGLNDKFLMIRDLFDGDAERYEATIDTLDEFEDLDECMIYIVENFRWNPDSEAAKLIVSLLERKLA